MKSRNEGIVKRALKGLYNWRGGRVGNRGMGGCEPKIEVTGVGAGLA